MLLTVIVSVGPNAVMGEICSIVDQNGNEVCKAEVVGFKNGKFTYCYR